MDNILSITDKKLIDNLVNNSENTSFYNKDIGTLIFSNSEFNYDDKTVLYKNIHLLLDKFYFIYKENMTPVDNYICRKIADFIIGKFIYYTNITNFPDTLFKDTFISFLIKEKLFFTEYKVGIKRDSIFNNILGLSGNYFNIQYNFEHEQYYINHAKKLKMFLNQQLLSYVILNKYEVNLVYNFLKLTAPAIGKNTNKIFDDLVSELFENFYNGIANMITINIESVEFYKKIYRDNTYADINKTIKHYNNILINLGEMKMLRDNLFIKITSFNINEFTETEIETITHMSNITTYIGDNYYDFRTIFTPVILNILKSKKTNIHDKTKVILSVDKPNIHFIVEYIKIFVDIEKYNTTNGFRFKTKIRTRILYIMSEFLLNNSYIDLKMYITNSFITLYTNHINSIISIISDVIRDIRSGLSGNNKMMLMKYLLYLDKSIEFNSFFYKFFTNDKEGIYHFKIIENYYTILKEFIANKLYTQLSVMQANNFFHLVELGSWQIVDSLFSKFYNNLNILSENKNFITTWATNHFFYNKDTFDKTCEEYGEFNISEGFSVKDLLEKISTNIDNRIKIINDSADTYDIEIPDKFKDPIMLMPVKQAIEIPSVEIILDKYTIYNHLIFNESNPFTNETLTVNDLETYNNKPEVKNRVKLFVDDFDKWKNLHKT